MVEIFLESLFQTSTLPLVQTSTPEASSLCHLLMLTSWRACAWSPVWPPLPVGGSSELWARSWGGVPAGVWASSLAGGLSRHSERSGGPGVGGHITSCMLVSLDISCKTCKWLEAWELRGSCRLVNSDLSTQLSRR